MRTNGKYMTVYFTVRDLTQVKLCAGLLNQTDVKSTRLIRAHNVSISPDFVMDYLIN